VPKGTVYHQLAGGGGGYGDPQERPAELVAREVRNGIVSARAAREVYGVVLNERAGEVDQSATSSARKQRRSRERIEP
jgi:N-methylhydantoinase B